MVAALALKLGSLALHLGFMIVLTTLLFLDSIKMQPNQD